MENNEKPIDCMTVLTSTTGALATKKHARLADGTVATESYGQGYTYAVDVAPVAGVGDVFEVVKGMQDMPHSFVIRGEMVEGTDPLCARRLLYPDPKNGDAATFYAAPRHWFMVDMDGVPAPALVDPLDDPAGAAEYLVGLLPPELWDASFVWQWSASQGVKTYGGLRCHLFFWSAVPLSDEELTRWAAAVNAGGQLVDASVYRAVQPHYVAAPIFENMVDPLPVRVGFREGLDDEVILDIPEPARVVQFISGEDRAAGIGFEGHLARIGGPDGFRRPIIAACSSFLSGKVDPDLGFLKDQVKASVYRANPGARTASEIERYASDRYLDDLVRWIQPREAAKRAANGFRFNLPAVSLSAQAERVEVVAAAPTEFPEIRIAAVDGVQVAGLRLPAGYNGGTMEFDKATGKFVPAGTGSAAKTEENAPPDYDFLDFAVSHMKGKAPARKYLIQNVFPSAVPIVLAGQGAVGKSMMLLDAALKLAEWDGTGVPPRAFCGDLATGGRVVIVTAEDDWEEMWRRIDALDPTGARRERAGNRLLIVPAEKLGHEPLIKYTSGSGLVVTLTFEKFVDKLAALEDLAMVVLDPFSVFFHIDQSDTSQSYTTMSIIRAMCSKLKASIALVHHFAKDREKGGASSPEEARALIKGNSAIVDGARAAYALWATPEKEAEAVCKRLGITYSRGKFVSGAMVKANYEHDSAIHLYMREPGSPVLVEVTEDGRAAGLEVDGEHWSLAETLMDFANAEDPFGLTGKNGIYARRQELPEAWKKASRATLEAAVNRLVEAGVLVSVRDLSKAGNPKVLDAPDGRYALRDEVDNEDRIFAETSVDTSGNESLSEADREAYLDEYFAKFDAEKRSDDA